MSLRASLQPVPQATGPLTVSRERRLDELSSCQSPRISTFLGASYCLDSSRCPTCEAGVLRARLLSHWVSLLLSPTASAGKKLLLSCSWRPSQPVSVVHTAIRGSSPPQNLIIDPRAKQQASPSFVLCVRLFEYLPTTRTTPSKRTITRIGQWIRQTRG